MIRSQRFVVLILLLSGLAFTIGCNSKTIPATSDSTEPMAPPATIEPVAFEVDPFTTQASKIVDREPNAPLSPEIASVEPSASPSPVRDLFMEMTASRQESSDPAPSIAFEPVVADPAMAVEPPPAVPEPVVAEPAMAVEPPPAVSEPVVAEPAMAVEPPPIVSEPVVADPAMAVEPPPADPPMVLEPAADPFLSAPVTSTNPLRTEKNEELSLSDVPATSVEKSTSEVPAISTAPSPEPEPVPVTVVEPVVAGPSKPKTSDPLAELFVDWPKPKLLLVFTGFMNGYVEPCGCAGLDQMKGGLSRRMSFFSALEKKGWPALPIDAGNLNKGFGNQEELKFSIVIDNAYRMMKYGAVGIGNRELLFPTDVLILYSVDSPGARQRYTSANVAILEFNPEFTAPYRVFEEGGVKVGVVSVVGSSLLKDINNQDIVHEDPVKRLKALLPQFVEEKCDKRVLLVHGTTAEIEKIVKAVPGQFDFVVPGDTPAEPPFRPRWIGNSLIVEVGEKGKFAVALGIYDDVNQPFRYERIPLDARFENSEAVVALMQFYQNQLQQVGLEGLGIKPIPDRRAAENGKFVGSKACADCHEPSYTAWKKSRHAAAWRSLVETSKPARTHDPECIACHVVGWNPTEFLPYENGFMGEKETPHLLDVGCESCHGPGEMHVKAEQGSDEASQEKLRKAVRLPLEGNVARKLCIQCHDGDNSPHFDFDTYWPKVVHEETEQ